MILSVSEQIWPRQSLNKKIYGTDPSKNIDGQTIQQSDWMNLTIL